MSSSKAYGNRGRGNNNRSDTFGSGSSAGYEGGPSAKPSFSQAKNPPSDSDDDEKPGPTPGPGWDSLAMALQDRDGYTNMDPSKKNGMLAKYGEEAYALQVKNKHERSRRGMQPQQQPQPQRQGSADSRHEMPYERVDKRVTGYMRPDDIPLDSPLWSGHYPKEVAWAATQDMVQKDEMANTRQRTELALQDARADVNTATARIGDLIERQGHVVNVGAAGEAFGAAMAQTDRVSKERDKSQKKVQGLTAKLGKLTMTRNEQKAANKKNRKEWDGHVRREQAQAGKQVMRATTSAGGGGGGGGGGYNQAAAASVYGIGGMGGYGQGMMNMPMGMGGMPPQMMMMTMPGEQPQLPFFTGTSHFTTEPGTMQSAPQGSGAAIAASQGGRRQDQPLMTRVTENDNIVLIETPSIPKSKAKGAASNNNAAAGGGVSRKQGGGSKTPKPRPARSPSPKRRNHGSGPGNRHGGGGGGGGGGNDRTGLV